MTNALDRLKAALSERYAIERELGSGGMATVYLAEGYAQAGERERTLDWLEVAYDSHHMLLPPNLPASGFGPLPGDDPRYQELRRRVGLPQ